MGLGTRLPNDTNKTDFLDPGFLNEEIRAVVLAKLNRVADMTEKCVRETKSRSVFQCLWL